MTKPRTGQAPPMLNRQQFSQRFARRFYGPAYETVRGQLAQVEEVAWQNYIDGNKSPLTQKAGAEFSDPNYDLSVEWNDVRKRVQAATNRQKDPATLPRVLLICGADRNDGSCPGEMSKTYRLMQLAKQTLAQQQIMTDELDLSLLTSGYDKHIHPCKGCVSTAMPLCHWPCSCYPNHSLGQDNDWMGEIYEKWAAAHGIIILTPVYWYQVPSALKLMIDRLVCADGGNPDPTLTSGKDAEKAKAVELAGWDYPKHLAGRAYGVVVHGDVAGIEGVRHALTDWLDWMGLIDAGEAARLDRYIGYYESYALSHEKLDQDLAVQEEVRNVARAVAATVLALRSGQLTKPDTHLANPRPK